MPRRTHLRRRDRRQSLPYQPQETPQPTPKQLAIRLVDLGICDRLILGPDAYYAPPGEQDER